MKNKQTLTKLNSILRGAETGTAIVQTPVDQKLECECSNALGASFRMAKQFPQPYY